MRLDNSSYFIPETLIYFERPSKITAQGSVLEKENVKVVESVFIAFASLASRHLSDQLLYIFYAIYIICTYGVQAWTQYSRCDLTIVAYKSRSPLSSLEDIADLSLTSSPLALVLFIRFMLSYGGRPLITGQVQWKVRIK